MVPINETRINRLGLAGLIASFVLLIAVFAFALWGFSANQRASELVNHTYEVKNTISHTSRDLERAEAARRGYILDPSPYRREVFEQSSSQILPSIDNIQRQIIDNPDQKARLERLRPLLASHLSDMQKSFAIATRGQREEARRNFDLTENTNSLARIRALSEEIEEAEDALLTSRLASERRALGLVQMLLVTAGLGLLVASLGTMFMLRRQTRDLLASRARLHRLNTNLEGAVAERTSDLQRANDEIQRFAYIVSHDLRSPLVNVLGFTSELETANKVIDTFVDKVEKERPDSIDEKVRFAVKEDLPEAISFIRTSTQKMDRLINAILNLSRQGRRVLTAEHLPMEQIVGDISDSLATLAEERDATITIEKPLPTLHHDRLATEQLFQNLIENATKYLKPGVPGQVIVRGRRERARAVFEIEDNGRGIAANDHERIFELFRRSGSQDQVGEGIGLAHVRALAYRLGGSVTVSSALNAGATFKVDLPVAYQAEGDEG
jgi:signal transduction histidine kinase